MRVVALASVVAAVPACALDAHPELGAERQAVVSEQLRFEPAALDLGLRAVRSRVESAVVLRNDGDLPVTIQSIAISGTGYELDPSACKAAGSSQPLAVLEPGGSCSIPFSVVVGAGARPGTIAVTTATTRYTAQLAVRGGTAVTIRTDGARLGTVTSSPPGIECGASGTACSAVFAGPVTLTATGGGKRSYFAGWSGARCGTASTCIVGAPNSNASLDLTATFASVLSTPVDGAATVRLAGTAGGAAKIVVGESHVLGTCAGTCSVDAADGTELAVHVTTPELFGDLAGACTIANAGGADVRGTCSFTSPGAVTATFRRDPKTLSTRVFDGERLEDVAFDSHDNIIVVSRTRLVKLDPTATQIAWTRTDIVGDIEPGPGDTIYVATGTQLVKLAPTGTVLWSQPAVAGSLAVAPDGAVAQYGAGGRVTRWDSTGVQQWSQTVDSAACSGITVGPDGIVSVAVAGADGASCDLARFAPDGGALERRASIGGPYVDELAADSAGNVYATSTGSLAYLVGPQWSAWDEHNSTHGGSKSWLATSIDDVAWMYLSSPAFHGERQEIALGWRLRRYSASGTLLWQHQHQRFVVDELATGGWGVTPSKVAGSRTGRIAVVGTYRPWSSALDASASGWLQVYQP